MSDPRDPKARSRVVSIGRIAAAVAPAIELLSALTPDERLAVQRTVEALITRRDVGAAVA